MVYAKSVTYSCNGRLNNIMCNFIHYRENKTLAFGDWLTPQIEYPDYLTTCLLGELQASRHEWVVFEPKDQSGVSPGLTIPGLAYGLVFKRQG